MKKNVFILAMLCFSGSASAEIVLQSGKLELTADELQQAVLHVLPAGQQQAVANNPQNLESFIRDYAGLKHMGAQAEARGLDKAADVQIKLEQQRNRVLTQALIEDELEKEAVPDMDMLAKEEYLADPERFMQPERVHARHILIKPGEDETDEAARARAEALSKTLRGDVSRFEELAQQHSQDPSAKQNAGDLGFFAQSDVVAPFAEAAFAMKNGEVSAPVKTSFGYHVIHVLEKKAAGKQSYAEVREQLLKEVAESYESKRRQEIVARLRDVPDMTLDEEAVERLQKKLQEAFK